MYKSVFYSDEVLSNIRKNCDAIEGCGKLKDKYVKDAEYWMNLSYDELWNLIFDPKLERSWMVQSGGTCPACKDKVIMYDWIIDAKNNPWKLKCPKCGEMFPKNDFYAYYKSGLTKTGKFSYGMADQRLLYNAETGDKNDMFGVDPGYGYKQGDAVWRFIPTYLVYGQWIQLILGGIMALSRAYVHTQEGEYARRTLILLDRLADFWPEYDYNNQGWMYERFNLSVGYISYGVNGAFEACALAMAYDSVAKELYNDPFITDYLKAKPSISQKENVKKDVEDIRKNIETRIIQDYLDHPVKLDSNYPYTERALAVGKAVLHWWEDKERVLEEVYEIVRVTTLYDGLTGESSPGGYATMGKHGMASMLNLFLQADPDLIAKAYEKVPKIYDAYRFHIDIHCLDRYYPTLGDDSYFCRPREHYPNSEGEENAVIWKLFELTGDFDLLKVLVRGNNKSSQHLFDKFTFLKDIPAIEDKVRQVIDNEGIDITLGSLKKDKWEIALLRSGTGENRRAVWFNFGFGKTHHCHGDAMSYGLYYKGADVMTDLGYPNVGFGGGWWSNEANWSMGSISHNIVTKDHKGQRRVKGKMTLWSVDDFFQVARANAPGIIPESVKYERTLALTDISEEDIYLTDVFRVTGKAGCYEKYTRANTGTLAVNGLRLDDINMEYPPDVFMKDFKKAIPVDSSWNVDLAVEDVLGVFPEKEVIHWKYRSFTAGETICIASSWVPPSMDMLAKGHKGFWMPALISIKDIADDQTVTFVSVIEPYVKESKIKSVERIDTGNDRHVVLKTVFISGAFDIITLLDPDSKQKCVEFKIGNIHIHTDMQASIIRFGVNSDILKVKKSTGTYLKINDSNV